ncbi:MAG: recombinase family protein [Pseudomonas sp.]
MKIAVPYVRFSSSEQRHGSSLERQENLVSQWLARNPEYTRYTQRFEDLGLSGFHGHHVTEGAMGKLLDAIERGHIPPGSVVLVEALDRFSRLPPMTTLHILQRVVECGVTLVTLEDGQRYDDSCLLDHRLLFLAMKAQSAHDFSRRLSDLTRASYTQRATKAKAGEVIRRHNPFWLTSEGELLPEEASIVQQVFLAYSTGAPIRMIANQHTKYFKNRQSLKHALKSPAAIGHWQRERIVREGGKTTRKPGELILNVFAPVVPEELFYQVQKMLALSASVVPTVARRFPLAGLLSCGDCGANMVLLRGVAGTTDSVRCYRRMANTANCTNKKTMPVPVVGWLFYETMRPFAFNAYQRTKLPATQRERLKLEGKVEHLRQQQTRLRQIMVLDGMDADTEADYKGVVARRKLLEIELGDLPITSNVEQVGMVEFNNFLNSGAFVITNLLQLDGYRIICHADGRLIVNGSTDDTPPVSVQYLGYKRQRKHWAIQFSDGDVIEVDKGANIA